MRIAIATPAPAGWSALADVRSNDGPPERIATAADDVHRLMYTSGTTGRPKGVMITHANLAWKNLAHIVEFGITGADVGLACGPLYHVGALDLTTTTLIASGATTILHRAFDADRGGRRDRAVAGHHGVAGPRDGERDHGAPRHRPTRPLVGSPGDRRGREDADPPDRAAPPQLPAAWFADAYGLTETVSGDTFLDQESTVTKLGSVGRPCLYLEVDIWDESGTSLPPGERGEIVFRGPKVFKGYWRDPDATATAFAGGWFHTGDIGVRDEDGYLFIVDRLKDMILSGGENIAGSEVERVLYEHAAVLEAAVIGRPDERWGEVPVAFVVLRSGEVVTPEELIEHCRSQLARFKVPKDVAFLEALPRNPSGKVLKRELRAGA